MRVQQKLIPALQRSSDENKMISYSASRCHALDARTSAALSTRQREAILENV